MHVRTAIMRTIGVFGAIILFVTSGALAWAATEDYASRARVPMGVTLAGGLDLGGMTADEVRGAISREFIPPFHEPVTASAEGHTFTIEPRRYLTVDVEGAVARAFDPVRDSAINQRVWRTLADEPVYHDIKPQTTVDREALSVAVRAMAASIDRPAVDATLTIESGVIRIATPVPGRSTDVTAAVDALAQAFLTGEKRVKVPVDPVAPAVSEADLGRTIVISLRSRTLTLYDGTEVDRLYRVAVGKPGYSTPRGSWKIVQSATGRRGATRAAHGPPTCRGSSRLARTTRSGRERSI